ncbi:hypothetical protein LIER_34207 [Lithospermum erythrorhizon]|uniref:Uncharacterized protein n=1 Tax=Lithospermum erythrorhizon TaxID=34254 RepID=A0AAV3S2E5_LITER
MRLQDGLHQVMNKSRVFQISKRRQCLTTSKDKVMNEACLEMLSLWKKRPYSFVLLQDAVGKEGINWNKFYLTKIEKLRGDCVTFGGGSKGKITGKGCLIVNGLPELENMLLVDGLTVNLISIRLCLAEQRIMSKCGIENYCRPTIETFNNSLPKKL